VSLTWRQVAAWRLARQHLDARAPRAAMLDVAAGLAGVHAQLMSSAELTLWARVEGLEPDAVARALWEERALFKTWAMRGTLHLLPAAELGLWIAALRTRTERHYLNASRLRYFGVTREQVLSIVDAVRAALDGEPMTRAELADAVAAETGSAELGDKLREGFGTLLKPAAATGALCFAPNAGQEVRFARPDRWLGEQPALPAAQKALAEVTRRFLAAYGPATREDYARWWGTTPAEGGKLIAALGDAVAEVDVEGARAWMLSADVDGVERAAVERSVRLVPAFDQYVVGATLHAERVLPGDFADRIYRKQGWISAVVLVDGRMEGVWRHERKGARLAVEIEPFVKLPAWARRGVEEEAARLAAFLGGELELSWTEP
jgi:winged helix DNA-binding protein